MNAETNLQKLLTSMEPVLQPGVYVFCTIPPLNFRNLQVEPCGWFREPEGITLILEKNTAVAAGLETAFTSRMITLTVHSSLEAVGFLAAITDRLAAANISVNVVSAYYHDHLFVPLDKADQAIAILHQIMEEASHPKENQPLPGEQNV